jgi:hypothetical protein
MTDNNIRVHENDGGTIQTTTIPHEAHEAELPKPGVVRGWAPLYNFPHDPRRNQPLHHVNRSRSLQRCPSQSTTSSDFDKSDSVLKAAEPCNGTLASDTQTARAPRLSCSNWSKPRLTRVNLSVLQQQFPAALALRSTCTPSLVISVSTLTTASSSVHTSEADAVLSHTKHQLVEDEQGALQTIESMLVARPFPCPFAFLGCQQDFQEAQLWYAHCLSHLRGQPPRHVDCPFEHCDWNVVRDTGPEAWAWILPHVTSCHPHGGNVVTQPSIAMTDHLHQIGAITAWEKYTLSSSGRIVDISGSSTDQYSEDLSGLFSGYKEDILAYIGSWADDGLLPRQYPQSIEQNSDPGHAYTRENTATVFPRTFTESFPKERRKNTDIQSVSGSASKTSKPWIVRTRLTRSEPDRTATNEAVHTHSCGEVVTFTERTQGTKHSPIGAGDNDDLSKQQTVEGFSSHTSRKRRKPPGDDNREDDRANGGGGKRGRFSANLPEAKMQCIFLIGEPDQYADHTKEYNSISELL